MYPPKICESTEEQREQFIRERLLGARISDVRNEFVTKGEI